MAANPHFSPGSRPASRPSVRSARSRAEKRSGAYGPRPATPRAGAWARPGGRCCRAGRVRQAACPMPRIARRSFPSLPARQHRADRDPGEKCGLTPGRRWRRNSTSGRNRRISGGATTMPRPGRPRWSGWSRLWRARPFALAVVPAEAAADLPGTILQHGWRHRNHAGPEEKKAEYGRHRPVEAMLAELGAGRERLRSLYGRRFLPVLVPPWNRIDPMLAERLPAAGWQGLSVLRLRRTPFETNTHIDPVAWLDPPGFSRRGRGACRHHRPSPRPAHGDGGPERADRHPLPPPGCRQGKPRLLPRVRPLRRRAPPHPLARPGNAVAGVNESRPPDVLDKLQLHVEPLYLSPCASLCG